MTLLSKTCRILYKVDNNVVSYDVPATVRKIKSYAFYGCLKLQNINLINIPKFEHNALYNCPNLINISKDINKEELRHAFCYSERYKKYIIKNRDYKLKKLLKL